VSINYDQLKANDYIYFADKNGNVRRTNSPSDQVDFRLKGYMNLGMTPSVITVYSQYMPPGEHSPIATGWVVSGDWFVCRSAKTGNLAVRHVSLKETNLPNAEYTIEEVIEMRDSKDLSRIIGFESKYQNEMMGYLNAFIKDNVGELM